jgi:hypothetical protein
MIELVVLVLYCGKIGSMARDRRRSAWPYQLLTVLLWFGGEVGGAFVAIAVFGMQGLALYAVALGGAALGALTSYCIVNQASFLPPEAPDEAAAKASEAREAKIQQRKSRARSRPGA